MTVVIDLGCYTHPRYPEDESVHRLIDRFHPERLYGFDPHPGMPIVKLAEYGGCDVMLLRAGVWVEDGLFPYDLRPDRPLAAAVGSGPIQVHCIDVATLIEGIAPEGSGLVVKMDVEGCEYPLLNHMLVRGSFRRIGLLLVEWHALPADFTEAERDRIVAAIPCPVEAW